MSDEDESEEAVESDEDEFEDDEEIVAGPCPRCAKLDPIPIVYGLPGPGLVEQADRGEVEIGGCLIWPDQPNFVCRACGENY